MYYLEKNKIRDKRANTCIKKYGTAYPSQLSKFKEKQYSSLKSIPQTL